MATSLQIPISNKWTRSVNFFNGRLLTGEDLTAEQQANRIAHHILGKAIGAGVVDGLEVTTSLKWNSTLSPALTVTKGLAINRRGAQLLLADDTDIALVRPAGVTNGSTTIFQDCKPVQSGAYIAGAGVYMLTVGPAISSEGSAEASGIGTVAASCNSDYKDYGVQFRLLQIDQAMGLSQAQMGDTNHLRNLVAYNCFGVANWNSVWTDPLSSPVEQFDLVDTLLSTKVLTGCEVPLAVIYWTADAGIVFVDMWSVRRPVVAASPFADWSPLVSPRRYAEGIAMFLQFAAQVEDVLSSAAAGASSVKAADSFAFLPAAGFLPITDAGDTNTLAAFFDGLTVRGPAFIDGASLQPLVCASFAYPPIDLAAGELIWLYNVRENIQAFDNNLTKPTLAYVVFSNGHLPYQGDARFDRSYWDYSNYALC